MSTATLQGAAHWVAVHEKDATNAAVHQRHARHYVRLLGEIQVQSTTQVGVLR